MKRLIKKILSRRGESLVETLCAVLIFTLASVAMYSMVMASANINQTAKEMDSAIQSEMLTVEKADGNGSAGTVTMTLTQTGIEEALAEIEVSVDVYQEGDLHSYFRAGG